MLINVSCPSQEVKPSNTIDADYWGEVRKSVHQAHGKVLVEETLTMVNGMW